MAATVLVHAPTNFLSRFGWACLLYFVHIISLNLWGRIPGIPHPEVTRVPKKTLTILNMIRERGPLASYECTQIIATEHPTYNGTYPLLQALVKSDLLRVEKWPPPEGSPADAPDRYMFSLTQYGESIFRD